MDRKADRRIKIRRTADGKRTDRVKKAERERMLRLRNQDKTVEEIAGGLSRSERTVSKQLRKAQAEKEQEHRSSQASQKEVDPNLVKAKEAHMNEIRNFVKQWGTALRTPEIQDLYNLRNLRKLWEQDIPTDAVENNLLFGCVREHLPFPTLWQDYANWVETYHRFLDKSKSLVKQFGEELLKFEGVLGLGESYAEPLILRISHRVPRRIPKIEKEFCPKGRKEFCIKDCEILWDGGWRILYADDALACGKLYKTVSDRLFDSEGLRIRIILHRLEFLESKIRTSLQEILIKHDYINYTCRLCPDLSVRR